MKITVVQHTYKTIGNYTTTSDIINNPKQKIILKSEVYPVIGSMQLECISKKFEEGILSPRIFEYKCVKLEIIIKI